MHGSPDIYLLQDLGHTDESPLALNGHGEFGANSVAFSPDGKTLASDGCDAAVRLWDLKVLDKAGDKAAALALLERALELDSELKLNPQGEVERWVQSVKQ